MDNLGAGTSAGEKSNRSDGTREEYERILSEFGASHRSGGECVKHLESLGFSSGQARSAVYRYRQRHGLVRNSRANS